MKALPTRAWIEFLSGPLPLGGVRGAMDVLERVGNRQLRHIMEAAVHHQVLPKKVKLVQFVHIKPETMELDLEIPTLVAKAESFELLFASAVQGSAVQKTNFSFFRNAHRMTRHGSRGLICVIGQEDKPRSDIPGFVCTQARISSAWVPDATHSLRASLSKIDVQPCGDSLWGYVRGNEIARLFDPTMIPDEAPAIAHSSVDPDLAAILSGDSHISPQLYFQHIGPLVALGDVVLCVPPVHEEHQDAASRSTDVAKTGGGGMMFVVGGPLDAEVLEALTVITRRVCAVASGIWDLVTMAFRRAEELGYQRGEFMISHELDTPIGILDRERMLLSEDGRRAIDYLELWRRFMRRDWSHGMPEGLAALCRTTDGLFSRALDLGYFRALRRDMVPRRSVRGNDEPWTLAELCDRREDWLSVTLDMPEDVLAGNVSWCYQSVTWLLFLLIASVQHSIRYAFRACQPFDEWLDARGLRRGRIEVGFRRNAGSLEMKIGNLGDSKPPELPFKIHSLRTVRSQDFGIIRLPADGGHSVTVTSFRADTTRGDGELQWWTATITITGEMKGDDRGEHPSC